MTAKPRVGVVGVALRPCIAQDGHASLEERLHDAMRAALSDAGLTTDALEGIIVASNDQYDGRAISVMMASGPLGGVDRDILSTPSASEHALVLGALRVLSGQFETQLVVSWSPTEASSIPEAQRLAADPYYHRRLPLDELAAAALQANAIGHKSPGSAARADRVLAKNRGHGAKAYPDFVTPTIELGEPTRWPIRNGMVPDPVLGIVALMLCSEAYIAEHKLGPVAWISGMGWAVEPAFLGDRDLATAPALAAAAKQAYGAAGITDAAKSFDLAEISDVTAYQELLACETLGLTDSALAVNLSGGIASLNPVYCTGLVRIAEVAQQVRGRAGNHQKTGAKRGLAHAASGPAMQYQTVVVLEAGESVA